MTLNAVQRSAHPTFRARLVPGCAAAVLSLGLAAAPAVAQTVPPPQNVVNLSASASTEVERDQMTVVFSTTREGAEPAPVQAQLKAALDAALAEARRAVRPGELEVETGAFSLSPRYASPARDKPAVIVGWVGTAEMLVQGRDLTAIAQLTGRIKTLTIGRVGYSLSRAAREKVEGEVEAEAIARFRARAQSVSKQFGFGGYTLREVSVNSGDNGGAPKFLERSRGVAMAMADEALPVEAGKATVTANVSGSVELRKP
jgi:predicted secreted protein